MKNRMTHPMQDHALIRVVPRPGGAAWKALQRAGRREGLWHAALEAMEMLGLVAALFGGAIGMLCVL